MTKPISSRPNWKTELKLAKSLAAPLIEAARDKSRISGLTHNSYRYPARFSPKFVRAPGRTRMECRLSYS